VNKKQYIAAILAIFTITAITALTQNYLEAGWHSQSEIALLSSKLREIPDTFGDWKRIERKEIPQKVERVLNCYGYINDIYENSRSGAVVSVAVLFGPRGPIAVHTPEICYSSVGTQLATSRRAVRIESENHQDEFWMAQFSKQGEQEPGFEVWHAWSDGGPWCASENPRYWMTDVLYKLQLSGDPPNEDGGSDCRSFLQSFLPILRQHLGTD
jgi:hypothetical protein